MLKNYFIIAWRNLTKQKGLSFISVFGLSVGIACFSLCMLYAIHEFSFDNFHKEAKNIYRIYTWREAMPGNGASGQIFEPAAVGPAMKQNFPYVVNYVRYIQPFETFVKTSSNSSREDVAFTDPSFFSVFTFKLKDGNPVTALEDMHSIVLTERTARRIFGSADVVGKPIDLQINGKFQSFIVTAVAEDPPSNTSFQFSMLCNLNAVIKQSNTSWRLSPALTYVQLRPGSTLAHDRTRLAAFRSKYFPDEEQNLRQNGWNGKGAPVWFGLEPLRNVHTDTQFAFNKTPPVDPKSIWILLAIATGILLIACINFTTLAIGRSASRGKEVGIRKVIGGTKKNLVFQFLSESTLLVVLATAAGLVMAVVLLPLFNKLSGRSLHFSFIQFPQLIWLLAGLVLIVGLLGGSYPSFVLSRINPVQVLKTKIKLGGANFFTKLLVTIQFALSAGLIIGAVIMTQQLKYLQSKNPGFNKENVIVVNALDVPGTKNLYPLFKNALAAHPEVISTTSADDGLGEGAGMNTASYDNNGKVLNIYQCHVDPDYIPVLGMQLLNGRNFDVHIAQDTVSSVIINESLMNALGFSINNAIGQVLKGYGGKNAPVVIGVVKDFNFLSLSQQVPPQMFHQFAGYEPNHFFVRIKPGDPSKALEDIMAAWKEIAPDYPIKYSFLDDDLDRLYQSETRFGDIVKLAGGISIVLACLGLFGLAALATVNRTKEISIRKVLGASVSTIVRLLLTDFLQLVAIAFVIAAPLAWYLMNKWLQAYANRIGIEWWIFALTGIAITCIALATLSYQAIKAAFINPVKSLKAE